MRQEIQPAPQDKFGQTQELRFLIVGTPRSGTTLIQRLACELPGVAVPPETKFYWSFAPSLLERRSFPLDEAVLRQEIDSFRSQRKSRNLEVDPDAVVRDLGGRCDTPMQLFEAIVRQTAGDATIYGEKTPQHLLWWRPLAKESPRLKLIIIVRDPRAVVASNLAVDWGMDSHLLLAERWSFEQREIIAAQGTLGPGRCLTLRYEDVVVEPASTRRRLAAFIGLDDERVADSPEPLKASRIIRPWESWKANVLGPITPDRMDVWRESLTERQSGDIVAICRKEMRHFDYGTDAPALLPAFAHLAHLPPDQQLVRLRYRASRYKYRATIRRLGRQLHPAPQQGEEI